MTLKELNEEITKKVMDALKKGVVPWQKPWTCAENAIPDPRLMPVSYATGKPYSIINQWNIMLCGHGAGEYATFNQIKAAGGRVKKGEHGSTVYFYKTLKPVPLKDKDGNVQVDGEGKVIQYFPRVAQAYHVFNIYTQCEGIEAKWLERALKAERENGEKREPLAIIEAAQEALDAYLKRSGVTLVHGGGMAYYTPCGDSITLPPKDTFRTAEAYYKTAYHESAHSTGIAKRLNRKMGGRFGTYDYGREELVAEMTASMICGYIGIDPQIEDTAAYIQSWMKQIHEDTGAVMYAARQAVKATAYFNGAEAIEATGEEDGNESKAA